MAAPVKHSGLVDYTSYSSDTVEPLGEVEKKMVDFLKEKLPEINACLSDMKAIETKRSEIQSRQEQVGREYAATVQTLAGAEAAILAARQRNAEAEAKLAAIQAREAEIEANKKARNQERQVILMRLCNEIFTPQIPNLDGYISPDSACVERSDEGKSIPCIKNLKFINDVLENHGEVITSLDLRPFKDNIAGIENLADYLKSKGLEQKIIVILHPDVREKVGDSLADIRIEYSKKLKPKA